MDQYERLYHQLVPTSADQKQALAQAINQHNSTSNGTYKGLYSQTHFKRAGKITINDAPNDGLFPVFQPQSEPGPSSRRDYALRNSAWFGYISGDTGNGLPWGTSRLSAPDITGRLAPLLPEWTIQQPQPTTK